MNKWRIINDLGKEIGVYDTRKIAMFTKSVLKDIGTGRKYRVEKVQKMEKEK